MQPMMFTRRSAAALFFAAALVPLAACAPVTAALDNPLSGAETTIAVNQTLQVRLSNVDPTVGAWQYVAAPVTAVTFKDRTVRAPESQGVRQLEMFNFTGAKAGTDQATFHYVKSSGEVGDEIVVKITVQ